MHTRYNTTFFRERTKFSPRRVSYGPIFSTPLWSYDAGYAAAPYFRLSLIPARAHPSFQFCNT